MSTTNDAADAIAVMTRDQLRGASTELRALADKLDAFRAGDSGAWTTEDTVAAHALLTIVQSHTAVTRQLREAAARQGNVSRLDDRRQRLGSPAAP